MFGKLLTILIGKLLYHLNFVGLSNRMMKKRWDIHVFTLVALIFFFDYCTSAVPRPDNLAYKKPTKTSAGKVIAGFGHTKAVDGDRTANLLATKSCFQSALVPEAFWSVDLQAIYNVRIVLLVNNKEKYFMGKEMKIMLTEEFDSTNLWKSNYTMIGHQMKFLQANEIKLYRCPTTRCMARYVVLIRQPASFEPLVFCEIEVYDRNTLENLALQKNSESLSGKGGQYLAPNGNDGFPSSTFSDGSCFQSADKPLEEREWWRVDMGREYQVRKMTMTTRGDCCGESFFNVQFLVGKDFIAEDAYNDAFTECKYQQSIVPKGNIKDFFCKRPAVGRYAVVAKKTSMLSPLMFCELEVFGHIPEVNYAENKPTLQIDEIGTTNRSSSQGADGNINPDFNDFSCIETPGKQKKEWWSVDLGVVVRVRNVVIVNRGDCCGDRLKNFKVLVARSFDPKKFESNTFVLCHDQKAAIPAGHIKPLYCPTAPVGKYVIVVKEPALKDPLSFCELEVYGYADDGNLAYGKPTNQRSTYWKYKSDLAVDGDQEGECATAMTVEPNAGEVWFHIDLLGYYEIDKLVVVNKRDCKNFCLRDFYIYISREFDKNKVNPYNYTLCHHQVQRLNSAERKFVKCKQPIIGRHVTIIAEGNYPLTICEIEVYESSVWENLAINKKTIQSSDVSVTSGSASLAVDGWRMTDFDRKSCSMTTGMDREEWWSVDLGKVYRVRRIVIVNREDGFAFRLKNFRVLVAKVFVPGKLASSVVTMCYEQQHAMGPGEVKDVNCNQPTFGQYVIVSKTTMSPLTLCEVEVYGSSAELNIALLKDAIQTGETDPTVSDRLSSRAVDGNTDNNIYGGSCMETPGKEDLEWWSVDLRDVFRVISVVIYNRGDCCGNRLRNFRIMIAMMFDAQKVHQTMFTVCHAQTASLTTGEMKRMDCKSNRAIGRYLIIMKEGAKGDPLQFCEVEVYGNKNYTDPKITAAQNKAVGMAAAAGSSQGTNTPSKATDGNPTPDPNSGFCFVSRADKVVAWWKVDLKYTYEIEYVTISSNGSYLLLDILATDSFDVKHLEVLYPALTYTGPITTTVAPTTTTASGITTTDSPPTTTTPQTPVTLGYTVCKKYMGRPFSGELKDIRCDPNTKGRHVIFVKKSAYQDPLVICEVEVHGKGGPPSTTSMPTTSEKPTTPPPTTQAATPSPEPATNALKPTLAAIMALTIVGTSIGAIFMLKKKFTSYGLFGNVTSPSAPGGPSTPVKSGGPPITPPPGMTTVN
ncbi:uncharacterized protein LOC135498766 [Lineus longissimus]|uniref:uncharacterized protein LOC135498766 n=1 Tax=Lineus longissimus TaxID=88925 RepID=UPI002B4CBDAB